MGNYYEELLLQPEASPVEIQTAIDSRYNEWRQLATHPDPAIVEEANRNLRLLEQVRMTLTDPSRRAAYDAGIGLGGGGLTDPSAILQKAAPPPPKPGKSAATKGGEAGAGSGLWDCPKCGTNNPEWTQYCLKCRMELVRLCPECGQMKSLVKTDTCGNCGFEYHIAEQRAELRHQISGLKETKIAMEQKVAGDFPSLAYPWEHFIYYYIFLFQLLFFWLPGIRKHRIKWEFPLLWLGLFSVLSGLMSPVLVSMNMGDGDALTALLCGFSGIALLVFGIGLIVKTLRKRAAWIRQKREPVVEIENQISRLESEIQSLDAQKLAV